VSKEILRWLVVLLIRRLKLVEQSLNAGATPLPLATHWDGIVKLNEMRQRWKSRERCLEPDFQRFKFVRVN
jgi:hypothetical protein